MTTELEKLVAKEGVAIEAKSGSAKPAGSMANMVAWDVTMKYQGRRMSTPFFTTPGYAPIAADVVYSLCEECKSLEGATTFDAWAAKHKMNPDSRSAYAMWDGIQKSNPRLKKFLGRKFKEFASAKHK